MTQWLTVREYADQYSADRKTVYKWIGAGLIECYRVGRVIRLKNQPPAPQSSSGEGRGAATRTGKNGSSR